MERRARVLSGVVQGHTGRQEGCSQAASEEAHGEMPWFKFSGWAWEGSSHCPQPPSGTKAVIAALQTVPMPVWHKHSCFLQPSHWETSDTAHELCFVMCLGQDFFLMVGRDYKQGVPWVLVLNFGWVGYPSCLLDAFGSGSRWAKGALVVMCFAEKVSICRLRPALSVSLAALVALFAPLVRNQGITVIWRAKRLS